MFLFLFWRMGVSQIIPWLVVWIGGPWICAWQAPPNLQATNANHQSGGSRFSHCPVQSMTNWLSPNKSTEVHDLSSGMVQGKPGHEGGGALISGPESLGLSLLFFVAGVAFNSVFCLALSTHPNHVPTGSTWRHQGPNWGHVSV